jgi:hypothetical protein
MGLVALTAITTPTANLADSGLKRPKMHLSQVAVWQPFTAHAGRAALARHLF